MIIGFDWEGQVKRIQHDFNNPDSMLHGKVLKKLDFWITNKKHVWYKTIKKLPSPLNPDKTVDEDFIISKHKNHVQLYPRKYTLLDGEVKSL